MRQIQLTTEGQCSVTVDNCFTINDSAIIICNVDVKVTDGAVLRIKVPSDHGVSCYGITNARAINFRYDSTDNVYIVSGQFLIGTNVIVGSIKL